MNRLTLTALALALLGGACRAGEGGTPDPPPPPKPPWERVEKFVGRLRGRLLAGRIEKGMTKKHVEEIVGDEPFSDRFLISGTTIWIVRSYPGLGMRVCFNRDDPCTGKRAATLRVYAKGCTQLADLLD